MYGRFPFFWSVKKYRGRQCRIRTLPPVEDARGSTEGKQRLVLSEPSTGIQTTQSLPNQPFTLTRPLCIANALRTASLKRHTTDVGEVGWGECEGVIKNASESRTFHHVISCAVHASCLPCILYLITGKGSDKLSYLRTIWASVFPWTLKDVVQFLVILYETLLF